MKYRFRTKPWPHQVRAMRKVLPILFTGKGAGLYVPMRWGKSKVGIDVAGSLHLKLHLERCLVITTTSGVGVWENQIRTHCAVPYTIENDGPDFPTWPDDYNSSPTGRFLQWRIVNYWTTYDRLRAGPQDRSWVPQLSRELKRFKPEFVIVDESHYVANAGTLLNKMAFNLSRDAKVLIMTGTMFHRGPLRVFGQFKVMDPSVFGTSYGAFEKEYALTGGFAGKQILRYRNLRKLKKKVRAKVFHQKYVPQTPPQHTIVPVRLKESADIYRRMADQSFVLVDGEPVTAQIVLTRHLRLLQMAGGFVKTEAGKTKRVGHEKADMFEAWLREVLEQEDDATKKIVVGCRFIPELREIAFMCKRVGWKVLLLHGGIKKGAPRDRRIAAFHETKHPTVFAAQVSTGKEAIDLSCAGMMAFYSLPESYLDYDQFCKRIEKFRETRTLAYYLFLAKGTQDVLSYLALKTKRDVVDLIMDRPDLVERITAQV